MKYENQILAVIVLYKQKLSESKSFKSLSISLKKNGFSLDLFVYDNSPSFNEDDRLVSDNWQITYYPSVVNDGVSKAYNVAADYAVKKGKKMLLLLDQDTNFPEQTVISYLSAINKFPTEKLFAPRMLANNDKIISPCHFRFMRGSAISNIKAEINSLKDHSIINCGMCIDIEAFYKNGGYNELIKLDFSDHDFIKRFRSVVTTSFVVVDLDVYHQLSTESKNSLESDTIRWDYYLDGANNMSATKPERFFLKLNATMRSVKLSLVHKNFDFLSKLLRWI